MNRGRDGTERHEWGRRGVFIGFAWSLPCLATDASFSGTLSRYPCLAVLVPHATVLPTLAAHWNNLVDFISKWFYEQLLWTVMYT